MLEGFYPGVVSKTGKEDSQMAKKTFAYTGKRAPVSGQYRPAGGRTEYTLSRGDVTPPNNFGKLQRFTLVDRTKHKN